jgi:amino acid transporter
MLTRIFRSIVGPARDPRDPKVYHQISLIAFLAWVGIGADGLSSSCYGPEEAFKALGEHRHLAVFLALATALTVAVISAGYAYVIEAFPSGGGGYVVATKRLGSGAGLVAGGALLVDYVLTISISIAGGADAVFSFIPRDWHTAHGFNLKLAFAAAAIVGLMVLNLRGVKESVLVLMPIFLVFLATHIVAIAVGVGGHADGLPAVARESWADASGMVRTAGLGATLLLFLKAYSLGAGTYTGVEAVSNSMQVLREPRVETGKRTMVYLAISLAAISAGILLGYLLLQVSPTPGKTLNAVLLESITERWGTFGRGFVLVALLSEAALLFVAAQAGFIGGPRMMATMAVDRWMPQRFARLSDRLVVQDGVILMSAGALLFLIATGGSVEVLVVLYSINVFITFVLSQLGMVRHWWTVRTQTPGWRKRLAVNGMAFLLCAVILAIMLYIKVWLAAFEGHWGACLTVLITAGVCAVAWGIRRHYRNVAKTLRDLDILLTHDFTGGAAPPASPPPPDLKSPTAVLLVSGYNGIGMHSLLSIVRLFPAYFKNLAFVMVGVVDFDRFKGRDEVDNLKRSVEDQLARYAEQARRMGLPVETYSAIGLDPVDEMEKLCPEIARKYPRAVFFGGQLVFPEENLFTRQLHSGAVFEIQRRLHFQGLPMMVMPIRVRRQAADMVKK